LFGHVQLLVRLVRGCKKYTVPKEIKEALLRQSDYTRKTQEIAEHRRQIEQERASVQQLAKAENEHLQDLANLRLTENVLQRYQGANWQQMAAEDPAGTQARWIDYQQAQEARRFVAERISQHQNQRGLQAQQELAKRVQESEAALASDDKTWTEARSAELSAFIQKQYGFNRDELAQALSPKFVRLMRDAMTGRQALTKATAKPPPEQVKPAVVLKANTPTKPGLHDGLSVDEWMRRHNSQTRRKA
jgi:ribonuclease HI